MKRPRQTLVVSLDETLIRTRLRHEAFWSGFARDALLPLRAGGALMLGGHARLDLELAARASFDPTTLPYAPEALAYIRRWKRQRGKVVLLGQGDPAPVQAVANHLDLFDDVLVPPPRSQTGTDARARFLASHYGAAGFAYMSGARGDLPVWAEADRAVSVGASPALRQRLEALGCPVEHLRDARAGPGNRASDWAQALAVQDWAWNLAVFLALLALEPGTPIAPLLGGLALVWLAFGLTGSGAALMRELLRLDKLRGSDAHPSAAHVSRPLAEGRIPSGATTALALGLPVAGLAVGSVGGGGVLVCLVLAAVGPILAEQHALGRLGRGWLFRIGLIALRPFAGLLALGVPLAI